MEEMDGGMYVVVRGFKASKAQRYLGACAFMKAPLNQRTRKRGLSKVASRNVRGS